MNSESQELIECVLNLSEGRNLSKIQDVSAIIDEAEGCRLMHRDIGWDPHRTVFTIVGGANEVLNVIERIIVYAIAHFDIRSHQGIHPFVGVLDVIPFVALQGVKPNELRAIINRFWNYMAATYNLSLIAYGDLSSDAYLMTLAHIRKGGIVSLRNRIRNGNITIDYGPNEIHESQGVYCTTVRPIMIAYNINLDTKDITTAQLIAKELKALRKKDLRIKDVRFLAWYIEEYGKCQISTNLYDVHAISMTALMELVCEIASNYNIVVNGSEMIGMAPAFGLSHNQYTIDESIKILGLDSINIFNREKRLLDLALGRDIL